MEYSTKQTYNNIANQFSASRNYIWPDIKPYLDQVQAGASILDLGCGNGRILNGLPNDISYLGIDQSSELLKIAKKLHPKQKFISGDITKPKIWQNLPKFDYIFCIAVIHHLPETKNHIFLLEQIKSHLNPNGKVVITAWNLWQSKYLKYHLDIKTKLKNPYFVYIPFQGQPRFHYAHNTQKLKNTIKKANFNLKLKKTTRNYIIYN